MPSRRPPPPPITPTRVNMIAPTGPARLENARALPLDQVDPNPDQARQHFSQEALDELTESVRLHGVLQPILVQPRGARYQIIAGERRYRAARAAGLVTIPAILRDDLDDTTAAILMTLENLQREDLDLEDEARQFARLLELTGLSQRALAAQLGKHRNYINRRMLLLDRPDLLQALRAGTLTQQEALQQLSHGGTETDGEEAPGAPEDTVSHGGTPRTRRAAPDPAARFERWAARIEPALVAAADRPALRRSLETAIATAQRALDALDSAD